jgi:tRNA threonylcarbamoyladenosine biosynthesis protein TsaE
MVQPSFLPSLRPGSASHQLGDLAATRAFAEKLAAIARVGDVIALEGPIGAGKTTFARFFIKGIGYQEDVPSPTFNLVQTYEGEGLSVWHFDLYRLSRPEDVYELGIEQAFDEGITLIEWPDQLGDLLPAEALSLTFRQGAGDSARIVDVDRNPHWADRLDRAGLSDYSKAQKQ